MALVVAAWVHDCSTLETRDEYGWVYPCQTLKGRQQRDRSGMTEKGCGIYTQVGRPSTHDEFLTKRSLVEKDPRILILSIPVELELTHRLQDPLQLFIAYQTDQSGFGTRGRGQGAVWKRLIKRRGVLLQPSHWALGFSFRGWRVTWAPGGGTLIEVLVGDADVEIEVRQGICGACETAQGDDTKRQDQEENHPSPDGGIEATWSRVD